MTGSLDGWLAGWLAVRLLACLLAMCTSRTQMRDRTVCILSIVSRSSGFLAYQILRIIVLGPVPTPDSYPMKKRIKRLGNRVIKFILPDSLLGVWNTGLQFCENCESYRVI